MDNHDQQQIQHATQADLVRALESIDQSITFSHDLVDHQQYTAALTNEDVVVTPASAQANAGDLEGWTREQLQAEIVKLRRLAANPVMEDRSVSIPDISIAPIVDDSQGDGNTTAVLAAAIARAGTAIGSQAAVNPIDSSIQSLTLPPASNNITQETSTKPKAKGKKRKSPGDSTGVVSAKKVALRRDDTGKRLEKERRTELSKVVRNKMRAALGIGPADPIPHPYSVLDRSIDLSESGDLLFVPDWNQVLNDEKNVAWVAKIEAEVRQEAGSGAYHRVPVADLDPDIINYTTRTAFQNLCKRYMSDNHPKGAERRERYTKKRRRWARKDLKQKKRAKSSTDPLFADIHLPSAALHLDYMSSEYSSAGEVEDDPEEGVDPEVLVRRKEKWNSMVNAAMEEKSEVIGKGGWAVGLGEKVLEVRTPRWRSEQLNDIYIRLDSLANEQAEKRANTSKSNDGISKSSAVSATRAGHVAPSHRRFTLEPDLMRKGHAPRDLGEGWMWASGIQGVWPFQPLAQPHPPASGQPHSDVQAQIQSAISVQEHDSESAGVWDTGVDGIDMGEVERLGLVSALEGLP